MIKNTESAYGVISIALHWLMALTIFFMFGLGLYMVELSYYDSWYKGSLDLHKSLGIVLVFFLIARLVWKTINLEPKPLSNDKLEVKAAKLAHWMLYCLMALLMVSGYLISTADGRGIDVFGLFEVPGFGAFVENQEDIAGEVHEYLAWILIGMAALHALAALKHHFVNKDATLMRMIRVSKS